MDCKARVGFKIFGYSSIQGGFERQSFGISNVWNVLSRRRCPMMLVIGIGIGNSASRNEERIQINGRHWIDCDSSCATDDSEKITASRKEIPLWSQTYAFTNKIGNILVEYNPSSGLRGLFGLHDRLPIWFSFAGCLGRLTKVYQIASGDLHIDLPQACRDILG